MWAVAALFSQSNFLLNIQTSASSPERKEEDASHGKSCEPPVTRHCLLFTFLSGEQIDTPPELWNELNTNRAKGKSKWAGGNTGDKEELWGLMSRGSASRKWTNIQKKTSQMGPRGQVM